MQGGRLEWAASPLLLLWQQGGRREAQRDARNGRVEAVARRARSLHRQPRNVGQGDGGLFRAAEDMARRAEQGQAAGLVSPPILQRTEGRGGADPDFLLTFDRLCERTAEIR